jgi:hypothetical protein
MIRLCQSILFRCSAPLILVLKLDRTLQVAGRIPQDNAQALYRWDESAEASLSVEKAGGRLPDWQRRMSLISICYVKQVEQLSGVVT